MNGVKSVLSNYSSVSLPAQEVSVTTNTSIRQLASAESVVQNITKSIAKTREDIEHIQKVSDIILGQKTRFSVNEDSGDIVVALIDPRTDTVIREIPSQDEQRLHAKIKRIVELASRISGVSSKGAVFSMNA